MSEDDKTESADPTTLTVAKTLWSETLIELLVVALQKGQDDGKILELLKELKQKGFKTHYIIGKIKKSLGDKDSARIRSLLSKN